MIVYDAAEVAKAIEVAIKLRHEEAWIVLAKGDECDDLSAGARHDFQWVGRHHVQTQQGSSGESGGRRTSTTTTNTEGAPRCSCGCRDHKRRAGRAATAHSRRILIAAQLAVIQAAPPWNGGREHKLTAQADGDGLVLLLLGASSSSRGGGGGGGGSAADVRVRHF